MSIAKRPSRITLPPVNRNWHNLLAFLTEQFPHIEESEWRTRLEAGKISWKNGELANVHSKFEANRTLNYYREVAQEPKIEAAHHILFQNEHFLIADKPHYLPVTPGGRFVNECLLERLRLQCHLPDLVPVHRLDRETAGLVMFSLNKKTRGEYAGLFMNKKIHKKYLAVAKINTVETSTYLPNKPHHKIGQEWQVANRIEKSTPGFICQQSEGEVNACSEIRLSEIADDLGLFELSPITGKTHQLRLHMTHIGAPILHDKFYPELQPMQVDDLEKPLQLLAKTLAFEDPLTAKLHEFQSSFRLNAWAN